MGEVRARVAESLSGWARGVEETTGTRPGVVAERVFAAELVGRELEGLARRAVSEGSAPLGEHDEADLAAAVRDHLFGLGGLQRWLEDESVENIDVTGADNVWVSYADGTRRRVDPVAGSDAELVELVQRAAERLPRVAKRFDLADPELSMQLPDGSRLYAVMEVSHRPAVSIRRHRYRTTTLGDLGRLGTVDDGVAALLAAAVRARRNIVVSGGTNVGKTTMLRALIAEIPPVERLVVVEDSAELDVHVDVDAHPDVVSLEVRDPGVEGTGGFGMARMVRGALRMNPSRVIVGEARGAEVAPMLWAMSQGNDGSLCTVHAESSAGVFDRLALYAQSSGEVSEALAERLVALSVHLVVHLDRSSDGHRVVGSIRAVTGRADGGGVASDELFAPGPDGRARATGTALMPDLRDRLTAHGFDPEWLVERGGGWTR
ncbi:MAG: CpaF family protein [Actinobacteria bacterium]|nr:CpaF family protein [Actinomycetota bacterium]